MGGRKEWQREFTRDIESNVSVRVAFDLERGRVIDFLVQLECRIEGRWRPVVRYDMAHGRAHCDVLDWSGRVVQKTWLPSELDLNRALSFAEHDVDENARAYRAAYEETKP